MQPQDSTGATGIGAALPEGLAPGTVRAADAPASAQALLGLGILADRGLNVLWVAADAREMERIHESLRTFADGGALAPAIHRFQPLEKDPAVFGERLALVRHLADGRPFIVAACPQALEQEVPRLGKAQEAIRILETGQCHRPADLAAWMAEAGYGFGVEVYQQGEAALRGGILDCWPAGSPRPVRIEFFGDEIESIRLFDDQTQCTLEKTGSVSIPQLDFGFAGGDTGLLADLLPENTLVVNPADAAGGRRAAIAAVQGGFGFYDTRLQAVSFDLDPRQAEEARRRFVRERCADALAGWRIHVFLETPGTLARFRELYAGIDGFELLALHRGVVHGSAIDPRRRILLVTESDFYAYHANRSAHARSAKRFHRRQERVSEAADIQPGDFVVHVEHGVGKYLGLVETTFSGRRMEVLAIAYAKGEKVYLPVTQAHLLSRYKGMGRQAPRPHALGSRKWRNDKAGAEQAVHDLAAQLLQTQAERKARQGFRFSPDSALQAEFEAAFPYTETPDQASAADEIKRDMEKARPMDRLLCGDVGFGKTEVAMRAAFKAAMDGMQVAVLVPTTVLAQQHYDTFTERMAAFPVRIGMVSRFRTRAQQNRTLRQTADGGIDILIGTHRLLSDDVAFKNLGLVVIDEEQRFGVEDKERLKELRRQVDVVAMSATPIPRTLYMGLVGVRDLSTIQTAPQERQPIETAVIPYDEQIVAEAIRMELHREGQVFYLHNRINTIRLAEARLRALVPEARIATAHGRMGEKDLSAIMHAFVQGRFDVLLCTTIIESGVDIPNCNTMIVENAERFGLSDLYQLRGRVGRSNHKAFAFFMPSPGIEAVAAARDRLAAIERHTGLGSGFRVALRDLELRGAGNLLGARQSGHICAVGFDLYCQLLKRSIALLQGRRPPPLMDVSVKLDFLDLSPRDGGAHNGAFIPYGYIEDENLRLRLYQRISALATPREAGLLLREIRDRFGKPPPEVRRLLLIAALRIAAAEAGIKSIVVRDRQAMLATETGYATPGGRHPRLGADGATALLKELVALVESLPSPS